ncbi:MAG: amino acid permease [Micrococcales bacterium]|nr:amino acid permease [Micrococcales bacterium]
MASNLLSVVRAAIGRSRRRGEADLSTAKAIPVLAADALSSVAYAPDQILLTLSLAGLGAVAVSPWVGLGIALVIVAVIASYRQTVRAYPGGGGDVEVAGENLGPAAALVTAAATLADYALTVAVSVACSAHYLAAVFPAIVHRGTMAALALIACIAAVTLLGLPRAGRIRSVVVYSFLGMLGVTLAVGLLRAAMGNAPQAPSAGLDLAAGAREGLIGLGGAFLVMRAFSAGAVALTGVETIATSVPRFRAPRPARAARALGITGALMALLLIGVLVLARIAHVRYVADPLTGLRGAGGGALPADYVQLPVLSQLAEAVFSQAPLLCGLLGLLTAALLVMAATSCFGAVNRLTSRLAQDAYLPKQLFRRGDRRVAAQGVVALSLVAGALVLIFRADVASLIQLYIVGVFASMTLSQLGMIRHWGAQLRLAPTPIARRHVLYSRVISATGFVLTGAALAVVLVTKLAHGAWITVVLIAAGYAAMRWVRRHYDAVAEELAPPQGVEARALPPRVHGIVLISRIHRASLRAIAFARATRPASLEIVSVALDETEVNQLRSDWKADGIPVDLTILDSPDRDLTRPVLAHVRRVRRSSPRELLVVFIPEYMVNRWWERHLHNRSAARLTRGLRRIPGVVVASVPWQPGESREITPGSV